MSLLWVIISNFKLHPITFSWSWKRLHSYNYPIRIFNIFHISLVKCVPVCTFHFTIYSFQTSPILNFIRKTVVEYLLIPEPPKCVAFVIPWMNVYHHQVSCRLWGTLSHHWSAMRIKDDVYRWFLELNLFFNTTLSWTCNL